MLMVSSMARRTLLRAAGWAAVGAFAMGARAGTSNGWMTYDSSEVKTLMPRTRGGKAHGDQTRDQTPGPTQHTSLSLRPPTAYVATALAIGVPAWVLYGIALQESLIVLGRDALPYPWTLCVNGRGERYGSYEETLAALKRHVGRGTTNVDCGAMQVNWGAHHHRLGTFEKALDPYPNLQVGASILRDHYTATGDWFRAVGLYHTGSIGTAQRRRRAASYADKVFRRLHRSGVDLRTALAQVGMEREVHRA
jgi:hypothetical protein